MVKKSPETRQQLWWMSLIECPAPKMQKKERMLSLYVVADHVDAVEAVAEAVAEDPRIEVTPGRGRGRGRNEY